MQNYRGQHFRGGYRSNKETTILEEVEVGLGKEYIGNFSRKDRSSSSRLRSGLRASANRHRNRCFRCREYDHFAKDCLNSQAEKELEQIKQMYNLDEEQTILNILATDMYDNLIRTNSDEAIVDHLNL